MAGWRYLGQSTEKQRNVALRGYTPTVADVADQILFREQKKRMKGLRAADHRVRL